MVPDARIHIQDSFKSFRHDQEKTRRPEETVQWVRERLKSLNIRILAKTMRIDTGRLDIPVYISLCGEDATAYTGTKKQMGKGATAAQSEASAVMELMERFSFFSFIHGADFLEARASDLGAHAVDASVLMRSVFDRHTPEEKAQRFLDQCPLRWVPVRNLTRGVDQWAPIDWFYLINEYNGPAAGNTLEEAILQALCEVVERHVGSIISHDERVTPAIDPESLTDPASRELVDKFRKNGIELYLRDFSLDTGIPTVGVLAYDPATFPEKSEIVFTAGTTSHPEKSLCRALTEVAQLAGDFENRTTYRPTLPKYPDLEAAAYLRRNDGVIPIGALPDISHDNMKVEIERAVAALSRIGLEVLVVNVSHPQLQVPAVYVMIPGAHFLEHTRNTDFPQHMARTVLRALDAAQASRQLEILDEVFGPRFDLTFFRAHSLEALGNPHEALKLFSRSLEQDPDPSELASIYVHIGSCYKDLGDYQQALEALEKAESHNGQLKEIYNLRGFCFYQLKEHHRAIEAFERAIELDPGSAIDYANIGSNLRELGHIREAVRLYKMALELDPTIDFARQNVERLELQLAQEASGS
ncbi:ribosomal protein S12 methylthiotransferase accessory factor [Desulfacinum hydrothermale DSM 13146]|uniref:Ribosomal protein S12 methylthiotransferase accessory factor n=1 Tax=Desulfacinum hydrothermale DSM 13146 TaxID=1121390 RepID=A0A1W1XUU8_9BACT|nr:YcaO-like family protein [Desulfacinum hydrothermale]SMC27614.1 ribosomal protein S12 methylthiotransferase accessory factor [Desulfacinum hydrothermale DSM 13146]